MVARRSTCPLQDEEEARANDGHAHAHAQRANGGLGVVALFIGPSSPHQSVSPSQ